MPLSKRDQRIHNILTATKQILDSTKDPLNLVPIPGLSAAASALSTLIGMVLVAKGNDETQEDLANTIKTLTSVIEGTKEKALSILDTNDDNLTRTRLVSSPELKERVATLEKDLKDLVSDAKNLEKGFLKLFLSQKNTDILLKIKASIDDATRKFQIQGGISIEMLINGIVDDIEHIKRTQQQQLDEKALKDLPHVNAGYTSALNPTTSGTLPGTRTALLGELTDWCLRSHSAQDDSFIYVVTGGAGTGKSTIAFEMAHRLENAGALGASFFFVSGNEKLNMVTYVLTTIAYQLAHKQQDLYSHMAAAARNYSKQGKEAEQLQVDIEDLIVAPLMGVSSSHRPVILILDALDECTGAGQKDVIRLLHLLRERLPKIPFPVRLVVTTRPEMHIEAAFNTEIFSEASKPYRLHEIPRGTVDGDISLFLNARLKDLSCWESLSGAHPDVIKDLTNLSAGLFIYADTIVKFLDKNPYYATDVLDVLLSDNPSDAAFSLENLDRLYITILHNALDHTCLKIPHMKEYIQIVLGSLALLQDHMSATILQELVGIPMRYIQDILGRLGSVVLKPGKDDVEIRMLHASFPQFLTDDKRCNDPTFYIDPSIHHHRIALTCLNVMAPLLKRNICELEDVTIMKSDMPGLGETIKRCIRPSLQYSCIYWATHLSQCSNPDQDILNAVTDFAGTKLLAWVETLSYMDRLGVAVPALLAALSWCEVNMRDEGKFEVLQLINDMHRIVLQFYTPINDCPEHLYISIPLLAPSCLSITQHNNSKKGYPTIKLMTPRDPEWGACLHTIPINSIDCSAVLSPDGSLIASGSQNGNVHIWDASIGLSKMTLIGHTKRVRCLAWAPDGQSLASGSADGTIRVWNATSGAQIYVQSVQSGSCEVYAIAWCRDGRQLVTGAKPGGVQVWDIIVDQELKGRLAIPGIEMVMTISKDARRAVDRTARRKLRIWDIECDGGRILKELPIKFGVSSAVFLHNNTQVAFCGEDKAIHVLELGSGECTSKVELESTINVKGKTFIYGIALSVSGNTLASSPGGKIQFFNTTSWESLGSMQGYLHLTASFSPDGRRLLTSFNTIQTYDLTSVLSLQLRTTTPTLPIVKHESSIGSVNISSDGERVAAVSRGTVNVWSLKSASLFCTIQGSFSGNTAFSPDTQNIAVGGYRNICIWDITTTQPTLTRNIPTANQVGDRIAWSTDGYWIAGVAYGPDNITRGLGVFNAATGEPVKYLVLSNQGLLWRVEFSHDTTMLYAKFGNDELIFNWKEGERVNFEQHRWETEIDRRRKFHKNAWIIREHDGKRLCWVQQPSPNRVARWGNYYAVGQESGRLDILHIEESPVDSGYGL